MTTMTAMTTTTCPSPEELAQWLDRELSERRADSVAAHVATCSVCADRTAGLRRLIGDLRAPVVPATTPQAVRAVLARLDDARPAARSRTWLGFGAGGLVMAAAVAAIFVWRAPADQDHEFQARGGGSGSPLEREVGTTLYTLAPRAEIVAAGASVHRDTPFTLGFRNLAHDPTWVMVFAVDAAGDTHWLYPGYTSAASDPLAIQLPAADHETLMTDSVILGQPALGPLRVITIVAQSRLKVSAIEPLRGPALGLPALRRRFPGAVVSERAIQVTP